MKQQIRPQLWYKLEHSEKVEMKEWIHVLTNLLASRQPHKRQRHGKFDFQGSEPKSENCVFAGKNFLFFQKSDADQIRQSEASCTLQKSTYATTFILRFERYANWKWFTRVNKARKIVQEKKELFFVDAFLCGGARGGYAALLDRFHRTRASCSRLDAFFHVNENGSACERQKLSRSHHRSSSSSD